MNGFSWARFLREIILKNSANGRIKSGKRRGTENHHVSCGRCDDFRIADVAQVDEGEKGKVKQLNISTGNGQLPNRQGLTDAPLCCCEFYHSSFPLIISSSY
jgi:hypothetical protein